MNPDFQGFKPPSWSPELPEIPDSISLERFMLDENYSRHPIGYSEPPFTCGATGKTYSAFEVKERVNHLARGLSKELGFDPHKGSEWDKVVGCFSLNTIDYLTLCWAVHRLGGIVSAVSAAYGPSELEYQMQHSGCKAIFTCLPLLDTCKKGITKAKIPDDKIFLLPMADKFTQGFKNPGLRTVDDLIKAGSKLPEQEPSDARWERGEGARRTAFLCYSSGTSGLPKGVMISHRNVIANTIQITTHETPTREKIMRANNLQSYTETCLGLLPMSHIYGLVVISHVGPYRGDGVIVLPKYEFKELLRVVQDYKIAMLYLVPPMIIHLVKEKKTVDQYDVSSVRACFTGAAPLGPETADALGKQFPKWSLLQGYGMTETATVVCSTQPHDIWFGTSGSILPGYTVRIVTPEGKEVTEYGQVGELCAKSPSVVLGYLDNKKATDETFVEFADGRYCKTGDEAMINRSKEGHDHVTITDRIKELIKVKGNQVAPAELESHLLAHPAVNDCVVIGIPSEREGEVPKAFVVKDASVKDKSDDEISKAIQKHVADHKTDYKKLRGGVEFIDVVPKSASGKILRRLLRDQEKAKLKKKGPKL
ncbi:phenylacetyl-CoA ligase [Neohortaea acidophila]|uniref:Phenylacetyl-CoA ligase n=1 Tax=Neohortaea acidophila TaxID=245834 RepID=A0A6A6PS40_9PEZI|nr:phenylacetyl-CoA ligase [Neohortaea acidophila]KAF2482802.1 phenylacetyl-CoA ligase [Neohortaea acidophila]